MNVMDEQIETLLSLVETGEVEIVWDFSLPGSLAVRRVGDKMESVDYDLLKSLAVLDEGDSPHARRGYVEWGALGGEHSAPS